jgi:cell division protein FtsQ
LRRLFILGCVITAAAALWWLTMTPLLDVDAIRVEGAEHTGGKAVLEALGIERGDPLLTVNVDAAAKHLAALPWVATADVRRSWPGTIKVHVVERKAVAAVAARGGGWVLVDASGRALDHAVEPALALMRVAGRPADVELGDDIGRAYQGAIDLAAVVPELLRPAIASLWPQEDGTLEATAHLPSGADVRVRFGTPDQLEAKLVSFGALLEGADLGGVRVIDLRVPAAPALTHG